MGTVYTQLSITERRRIERWRHAKVPVDEMARILKRCRSTIFGELKRNHFSDCSMPKHDGYYGAAAHLMQVDRRARDRKLSAVLEHIKAEQDKAAPKKRRAGKQRTRYKPTGIRNDGWNSKLAKRAKKKAEITPSHAAE